MVSLKAHNNRTDIHETTNNCITKHLWENSSELQRLVEDSFSSRKGTRKIKDTDVISVCVMPFTKKIAAFTVYYNHELKLKHVQISLELLEGKNI